MTQNPIQTKEMCHNPCGSKIVGTMWVRRSGGKIAFTLRIDLWCLGSGNCPLTSGPNPQPTRKDLSGLEIPAHGNWWLELYFLGQGIPYFLGLGQRRAMTLSDSVLFGLICLICIYWAPTLSQAVFDSEDTAVIGKNKLLSSGSLPSSRRLRLKVCSWHPHNG